MAAPGLDEFLKAARPANPDIDDDALTSYWQQTYGGPAPNAASLPTLPRFLREAKTANPDVPEEDLESYWRDTYGTKGASEKDIEGGFAASVKQTVGTGIKGAGQVAADFVPFVGQDNFLKKYGQSVIDANPTVIHELGDIAESPLTALKEATGNAATSVAEMVGARALGMAITSAAPAAGPLAPVVGRVGQLIASACPVVDAVLSPHYSD